MRKKVCLLLFLVFSVSLLFAANNAGRSIALRYLNLAINAVSSDDYETADQLAVTGISYDETVADFWFIRAKAASGKNAPAKEIIEYLEKAFELTDWLKFSKTNSVVMLADLYYKTGSYDRCLDFLLTISDSALPEAYYLEAAACYAVGKTQLARSVISLATSLYPDNAEFVSLFFKSEFDICEKAGAAVPYKETPRGEISNALLKRVRSLYEKCPDILLYASFFAEPEEAKTLLQLYAAGTDLYGFDVFYPYAALKCGFLSDKEAFGAYVKISSGVFEYGMLCRMASEVQSDEGLAYMRSFFASFGNRILFSTNEDSVYDLTCEYSYGRPLSFYYDRNCDGSVEWSVECDYGTPVTFEDNEHGISVKYHSFPSIKTASFKNAGTSYSFVPFAEDWTPVSMEKAPFGQDDNPFFVPVLSADAAVLSEDDVLQNANSITIPVGTGREATASFSVYNMIPVKGVYYENGKETAEAFFDDGILSCRYVDMDRDGEKEIIEVYKTPETPQDEEAQQELVRSLFGKMPYDHEIWLSELRIDTDGDSFYDYRVVYSEDGWTHTFWGVDGNGGYESSYSENSDKSLKESQFYHPFEKILVSAVLRNDRLLSVTVGEVIYSVFYDEANDFYWVYEKPDDNDFVPGIKRMLDEKGEDLNVTVIKQLDDSVRVLACKTCGVYFGVLIYE